MVEYEDAAADAILSLLAREYGFEKAISHTEDEVLNGILKEMARIIRSRIPASKPTSSQWRPMRTAPRENGLAIEIQGGNGSEAIMQWRDDLTNQDGMKRPAAFYFLARESDCHCPHPMLQWRPCHPEWNEDPDAG